MGERDGGGGGGTELRKGSWHSSAGRLASSRDPRKRDEITDVGKC